jgi:hypothetical protein
MIDAEGGQERVKRRTEVALGAAVISVAGIALVTRAALGTSSEPPLTVGTATGQQFGGGPNVTLKPYAIPPAIRAEEALSDALAGPFGDTATSAEAIYGLAVPNPGLGMLAKPTAVWVIIETDPCVPNVGPGEGDEHGPLCIKGGRAAVFVDSTSGEILGQGGIGG